MHCKQMCAATHTIIIIGIVLDIFSGPSFESAHLPNPFSHRVRPHDVVVVGREAKCKKM